MNERNRSQSVNSNNYKNNNVFISPINALNLHLKLAINKGSHCNIYWLTFINFEPHHWNAHHCLLLNQVELGHSNACIICGQYNFTSIISKAHHSYSLSEKTDISIDERAKALHIQSIAFNYIFAWLWLELMHSVSIAVEKVLSNNKNILKQSGILHQCLLSTLLLLSQHSLNQNRKQKSGRKLSLP